MEGAVEIREELNSNTHKQDSTQQNIETDSTISSTAESQNANQSQTVDPEPIKPSNNDSNHAETVPSKNETDTQNNIVEDKKTQDSTLNSQEDQKEGEEVSNPQENEEENKQPEQAKAKAKGKNKQKAKDDDISEERKGQVMSYVKALMGMHYMKNDGVPVEILPGFYLGSIGAAFNKKLLEENKIGHILCCCDGVKQAYPQIFKYKMLKLMDKPSEDITRYFEEASDFIHDILTREEKVLVHCFAGKSRSVTIMISYLLKHHKMSVDEAIALIRSKRSVIQPNLGFVAQLRSYEKKLKEKSEQLEKSE